jgi:hypothetical protein
MGISEKIDHIRQQPERIRMRYVWICTIVSMVFVLVIWIFSLVASKEPEENPAVSQSTREMFENLSSQKKSMESTAGEIGDVMNKVQQQSQSMPQGEDITSSPGEEGMNNSSLEQNIPVDNQIKN